MLKPKALKKKDKDYILEGEVNVGLIRGEDEECELTEEKLEKLNEIQKKIKNGANIFLLTEYLYLLIFICVFGLLIFFVAEQKQWTAYATVAFIVGALTSMLCGFIGMSIATESNHRTTYSA